MKCRSGFVSNSSSSSFIIGSNEDIEGDEEFFLELFGIEESAPLSDICKAIAEWMANRITPTTLEEVFEGYSVEELPKWAIPFFKEYEHVYELSVSNEDCDGPSEFLYDSHIPDVETDGFKMVRWY